MVLTQPPANIRERQLLASRFDPLTFRLWPRLMCENVRSRNASSQNRARRRCSNALGWLQTRFMPRRKAQISGSASFHTVSADLRRSELHRQLHLEPSDIFAHLYRISTEHNSNDAKRLFVRTFPAYPEIIEQSSR